MTKLNKILLGALAVQLLLAILMITRHHAPGIAKLEAIAADLDPDKVTKVQVFDTRDRNATGDDKPSVVLARSGDAWTLASGFDYPADAAKVKTMLSDLAGMKARGPMTTGSERHLQLGVADDAYTRKVIVTTDSGDHVFFLGGSAGGRSTAVRKGGDDAVYAVSDITPTSVSAAPSGWVDPAYLPIEREDITAIDVTTAQGTITLDRSGGAWVLSQNGAPVELPVGTSIDASKVDSMLAHLAPLNLKAPADATRDASHPTATIALHMKQAAPSGDAGPTLAEPAPDHVIDVITDDATDWVHDRTNPRAITVDKATLADVIGLSKDSVVSASPPAAPANAPTPDEPAPEPAPPQPQPAPATAKPATAKPATAKPATAKPATAKPAPAKPAH